jgi:hypothetical protein
MVGRTSGLAGRFSLHKGAKALPHFAGGLVGEGNRQDAMGRNTPCHKVRNTVCYCFCFSGSGARDDQKWAFGLHNCLFLSFI